VKLADIPPGSDVAYRCVTRHIVEEFEFTLYTYCELLGTDPEKVLDILAREPDWSVFLDDEDWRA